MDSYGLLLKQRCPWLRIMSTITWTYWLEHGFISETKLGRKVDTSVCNGDTLGDMDNSWNSTVCNQTHIG